MVFFSGIWTTITTTARRASSRGVVEVHADSNEQQEREHRTEPLVAHPNTATATSGSSTNDHVIDDAALDSFHPHGGQSQKGGYTRTGRLGGWWTTQRSEPSLVQGNDTEHLMGNSNKSVRYGTLPVIDCTTTTTTTDQDTPSLTSEYSIQTDWQLLRACAFYTACYVGVAIAAYSFVFEHWTIIDSIYFAVCTFTTVGTWRLRAIFRSPHFLLTHLLLCFLPPNQRNNKRALVRSFPGYGDLQPTTRNGQLFCIVFACYGVVILGIFIGIVGHAVSETQAQAVRKLKRGRQKHLLRAIFQSHRRVDSPVQWEQHESILGQHATLLEDATGVCRAELPEILVVVLLA